MDYIAPIEEEDRTQIELITQVNKLISLCSVNNDDMLPAIREKLASAVKRICNVDIDISKPIRQQLMILNEKNVLTLHRTGIKRNNTYAILGKSAPLQVSKNPKLCRQ